MSAIVREGNIATITPGQDLVSSMVPEFKQELASLLEDSPAEVRLDLIGAGMMDSIGIGVIIATHNSMKKKGGKLIIVNASENIIKLFKSMRLDQHLNLDS
ncbi:MAG: STAS domain-containing protein [Desulfomicrobium apsheronum]|nr:STAS domain-containing protein [Desulfomicrobium apsheronum]